MIDTFLRSVRSRIDAVRRGDSMNMPTQRIPVFSFSETERLLRLVERYREVFGYIEETCEEAMAKGYAKEALDFSGEEGE